MENALVVIKHSLYSLHIDIFSIKKYCLKISSLLFFTYNLMFTSSQMETINFESL